MSEIEENLEPVEMIYLDGKVEPAKLAGILGINVSLVYQNHQAGLYGTKPLIEQTYKEALRNLRSNLVKSVELKVAKEETERQVKLKKIEEDRIYKQTKAKSSGIASLMDAEDTMHPLMKKKLEQDIKLNRVKEVQAWIKVAEEKKQFLNAHELSLLIEPFVHTIKNILVSISTDFPETARQIESCMNNLYNLGEKIINYTDKDDEMFVDEMLAKDLEEELLELAFIPEEYRE